MNKRKIHWVTGKEKSVFCKSAFTAMSLTATVKHTTAVRGGRHNCVFPQDGCLHSCPPGGQNCSSFSPHAMYSLAGWHYTIYKKRKMALELLEDRPPPSVYLCEFRKQKEVTVFGPLSEWEWLNTAPRGMPAIETIDSTLVSHFK